MMKKMVLALGLLASMAAHAEGNTAKSSVRTNDFDVRLSTKSDEMSLALPLDLEGAKAIPGSAQRVRPRPSAERVYCAAYADSKVTGYSLYRECDNKDLGNAVWATEYSECEQAATLANRKRSGLACARYYNAGPQTTSYSVYRIADGQDLGKTTIATFESCQAAVRSARRGIFCSTYALNGQVMWSMYDIQTGQDLGTKAYATLEACQQNY